MERLYKAQIDIGKKYWVIITFTSEYKANSNGNKLDALQAFLELTQWKGYVKVIATKQCKKEVKK